MMIKNRLSITLKNERAVCNLKKKPTVISDWLLFYFRMAQTKVMLWVGQRKGLQQGAPM